MVLRKMLMLLKQNGLIKNLVACKIYLKINKCLFWCAVFEKLSKSS